MGSQPPPPPTTTTTTTPTTPTTTTTTIQQPGQRHFTNEASSGWHWWGFGFEKKSATESGCGSELLSCWCGGRRFAFPVQGTSLRSAWVISKANQNWSTEWASNRDRNSEPPQTRA
ncbi:hypothetical protein HZH68_012264 [Vespula germanica]|uniref:Uncharacterized protein n=1 Tax=Vespula germanica TaxID=30212 RepID=A0A834MX26_VESGE|nr:hypothetical protein HZH68_012264 [Vespula germanica]